MDLVMVLLFLLELGILVYISGVVSRITDIVAEKLDDHEKRMVNLILHLERLIDVIQAEGEKVSHSLGELSTVAADAKKALAELRAASVETKKECGKSG